MIKRAVPAERLIHEALETYQQRQDNNGLADANAAYGLMIDSAEYRMYEKFWRDRGSYDPTPKTAIQFLQKALGFYAQAKNPEGERFASLQLGRLYHEDGQLVEACQAYEASNQYHHSAQKQFPTHNFYVAPGATSWEGMIASMKKGIGCPDP